MADPRESSTALTAEALGEYRAERLRRLDRHVEFLEAELDRYRRLLARTLEIAVGRTGVSPLALLEVVGAMIGSDLSRPAWVRARERRAAEFRVDRLIETLRATDPDRKAAA